MATSSAPLEIGRVALTVHDLGATGAFYESVLGLAPMGRDGESARYGTGGRVLLELRRDPAARRAAQDEAGLFHTAFLLPGRADLGAWLHHAAGTGTRLEGISDHLVSEALYLSDPEGNGIEIYVDRPRAQWRHEDGLVRMRTLRLDPCDVGAAATGPWDGAPADTVIGHVHMRVGTLPEARDFIEGELGFALTSRYPGALFFGSGGYHHHLAANVWHSKDAPRRSFPVTGLAAVEIRDATGRAPRRLQDPWGTEFDLVAAPRDVAAV
ncbi:VOC family protein [Mangrovicoccus algicola]|uniref:VOC family protein n=1 Tax=Mangrovicoccus algicola TaxID=2771008 RepID=A0A8J7CX94_9RHOB|nr:VOC family protein [Mangrovicoccus algicola]MBE3640304.1 VOC family protein [Mangrovicoccus algicola]